MLSGARTEAIKEILEQKKAISVAELSRRFSVSSSTIRRDFKLLESAHFLKRTHGGAVRWEPSLYSVELAEKGSFREISKVAKHALSTIKNKDTIYLDGGLITLSLARLLRKDMYLNVVTNSVRIAIELASFREFNLALTGGNLKFPEFILQGPLSETMLEQLHVNKCFIDGVSIEPEKGLTTDNVLGAQMKRVIIKKADKRFVLATTKHFGRVSFTSVCSLSEVDVIITNKRPSDKIMSKLHRHKVKVMWE